MIFAQPLTVVQIPSLAVELGICNHGQIVLQTYPVRQPPQGERGADEVAELPGAVIGGGIVVDVIMNVLFVYMGTDKELILALCPAHRRFIADAVRLLRRHLAVGERLPDLVAQRPVSGHAVSFPLILIFDQHELGVCRGRIAKVGRNGPQLLRVQPIVKAVFQTLQGRPLIGPLVRFEVGCGRRQPSFPYDKRRLGSAAVFCIFWPP